MAFFDYFRKAPKTATLAKDRLSIIVARERAGDPQRRPTTCRSCSRSCWPVIARYETIDLGHVTVNLDKSGGCEVLELNIVLPDAPRRPRRAHRSPRWPEPARLAPTHSALLLPRRAV